MIETLMTHPAVRRHLGGPAPAERAAARAAAIAGGGHPAAWTACLRQDPASGCVGLVELTPHHDGDDVELSYAFLPAVWGRGLASEAVGAVVAHALGPLGLTRLVAETRAGNHPSRRLLMRIGMRHERTLTRFGALQALHAIGTPSGRRRPRP